MKVTGGEREGQWLNDNKRNRERQRVTGKEVGRSSLCK